MTSREHEELQRLQEYLDRAVARNDKPAKLEKLTRRVAAQQKVVAELEKYEAERARKVEAGESDGHGHEWLMSLLALTAICSTRRGTRMRKEQRRG